MRFHSEASQSEIAPPRQSENKIAHLIGYANSHQTTKSRLEGRKSGRGGFLRRISLVISLFLNLSIPRQDENANSHQIENANHQTAKGRLEGRKSGRGGFLRCVSLYSTYFRIRHFRMCGF